MLHKISIGIFARIHTDEALFILHEYVIVEFYIVEDIHIHIFVVFCFLVSRCIGLEGKDSWCQK